MSNPLFLAQIASLLGQPNPQAQQPPPTPEPVQPDIAVTGNHVPSSQYKDRQGLLANILPGVFKTGSTGGNILGALKDAFLIQAGHDPMYAPKLQQMRESEAIENYGSDPKSAIDLLTQVNPGAALKQYDVLNDNTRQQQTADDTHQQFRDQYENNTRQRALSLISSATDQTSLDAAVKRAKDYYTARGQEPDFEMPTKYDPQAIKGLMNSGIPVTDQRRLDDADAYKQAVLALNTQKALSNQEYRSSRLRQIDRGLNYTGEKTDHTINAPRTPTQIKGVLADKVGRGETLTPAEQKAWTMLNPPKAAGKASPISAVRQPDGSYVIKKN